MKINQTMLLLPGTHSFCWAGFLILLLFVHCDLTEPPANESLSLSLEDVSCTEAWMTLTTANIALPASVVLKQNDITRTTVNLTTADTLLYVDSLLPNKSYKFQLFSQSFIQPFNQSAVSSNELNVTTMDTTSHNFTWQTFTFGEHSSSALYDVAIIDENNIWAVGEIYMNDSLGQPDPIAYNAVHWDGSKWETKKISVLYNGTPTIAPLEGIFTFPTGEIILTSGLPYLPQGSGWKLYQLWDMGILDQDDGGVTRIWGTSMNDLYFVGRKGTIVHYNGSSWTKIESPLGTGGTTVNLTDIYGVTDGKEVWTCGWNNSDGHTVLIKIANNHSEMIYDSFNPNKNLLYNGFISSLWTNGKRFFWLTGTSKGIVKHSYINKNFTKLESFGIQYFPYRVRGSASNNIATSGDAAMIWHYNGFSWKPYEEILNLDDRIKSIDMNNGILVAVGLRYESILGKGLLIIGKK